MVTPPRPICLDEPCPSWEKRQGYCGHQTVFGPESCILYDPERLEQRNERIKRKAMEAKK
jgi:hypothetical protein